MNLLLIDDDKVFLNQLHQQISRRQHHALKASDVSLALKILNENKVDVILAGASSPGIPMLTVICKIKGRHPETPLILLCSGEHNYFVKNALLLGADVLVTKPLDFSTLFATISKYAA